jgi:hypothetical protein
MAAVLGLVFILPSTIVAVAPKAGSSGHIEHHKDPEPPQWPSSYSVRACKLLEALADSCLACEALHLQPNVKCLFFSQSYHLEYAGLADTCVCLPLRVLG